MRHPGKMGTVVASWYGLAMLVTALASAGGDDDDDSYYDIPEHTRRQNLQWGKGLPAQHLDMDLSCHITLPSTTEVCSFFNLQAIGAKHSGDIRSIPNKKGTAEYIELDLNELNRVGAEYVAFTCNAYSNGGRSGGVCGENHGK